MDKLPRGIGVFQRVVEAVGVGIVVEPVARVLHVGVAREEGGRRAVVHPAVHVDEVRARDVLVHRVAAVGEVRTELLTNLAGVRLGPIVRVTPHAPRVVGVFLNQQAVRGQGYQRALEIGISAIDRGFPVLYDAHGSQPIASVDVVQLAFPVVKVLFLIVRGIVLLVDFPVVPRHLVLHLHPLFVRAVNCREFMAQEEEIEQKTLCIHKVLCFFSTFQLRLTGNYAVKIMSYFINSQKNK